MKRNILKLSFYVALPVLVLTSTEAFAFDYLTLAHYAKIPVLRDTKTQKIKNHWHGTKASLGYVNNTGNTTSQTLNAAGNIQYARGKWVTLLDSTFNRASSNKGLTAQRFTAGAQGQYDLTKKMYSFIQGSYINDKFDGYTYVTNENIGLGRRLYKSNKFNLNLQTGPGAQQERQRANGKTRNLFAWLGSAFAGWNITKDANLSETLQSIWTDENTHTSSQTNFTTNIGAGFQMQLGFTVLQDTRPQPGKKHLSTMSTVSIVYNFA